MKLVLLPGHNPATKGWMQDLALLLKDKADSISIHHYDHWYGGKEFDSGSELTKIRTSVSSRAPYIFIGKSLGVSLALSAVQQGMQPCACVFIGTSLRTKKGESRDVPRLLSAYTVPTLFIQSVDDPFGSHNELTSLIKESAVPHATIHKSATRGHDYDDLEEISRAIGTFIARYGR